jgi:hypothetical protein
MPKQKKHREYLNADGSRYRLIPIDKSPNHHPAWVPPQERRIEENKTNSTRLRPVPKDVVARAYRYALRLPNLSDIAACFEVSYETLQRWRKENPEVDQAISKARSAKTQTMMHTVEQQAAEGNLTAVSMWMRYFRKDLDSERTAPATNINLQLSIIPCAASTEDWLEQRGELHIEDKAQALQDQGTPVFKGRPGGYRA